MRTTRRPDSPPPRLRPKNSSSSTPKGSRWSDDSLSSESSDESQDRSYDAKDKTAALSKVDDFTHPAAAKSTALFSGLTEKRMGVGLTSPEKLPGATSLKRSNAVRVGIAGKKSSFSLGSEVAETRGRGRARVAAFAVEVLEFAKTKIHMIKTGDRGSYGEYFLGVDNQGKLVGIKELRSQYEVDDLARQGKAAPTRATLRIHANREANDTRRFVPQLEVRGLVVGRDKKTYLIMKPMDGTVDDLLYNTAPAHQKLMGRTALYALAEHAAAIHRQGGIHGDMKTPNALWSRQGLMCVADCGFTSRTPTNTILRGTYFSPEMIENRAPYDGKVDTWSLLVSLVTSYNPNGGDGAFAGSTHTEIRSKLIAFSAWRSHFLGGDVPERYLKSNPFDAFFAPIIAVDPALARYIIKHGMNPNSEDRVSCQEIVAGLSWLGHGTTEQAKGLKLLGSTPTNPAREQQEMFLRNLPATD